MKLEGMKGKFEFYRKWFQSFLVKEFMNLPTKYQERFIAIADKFLQDCKRIFEEGKGVKEKNVKVVIEKILPPDNQQEEYVILGRVGKEQVKFRHPASKKAPEIGTIINHTMFSLDGEIWYSTKTELITGRKR